MQQRAAVNLVVNANSRISRLRREKIVYSLNKWLASLAKDDEVFQPLLFGESLLRSQVKRAPWMKSLPHHHNSVLSTTRGTNQSGSSYR